MWIVRCVEFTGKTTTVTTCSEFYARERFHNYEISKRCGYIKDCTIERI